MTTAILERLSTLSMSGQQLRRLPKILEEGLPKMPCTVPETDVPQLFREPYIHAGYRPTGHEWRYYFFSLFQKHNEVVNVWTHLLAALAVLLRFWAFVEAGALQWASPHTLPLLLFILSSITYLTCSLLAHLLQSKSELSVCTLSQLEAILLDYQGRHEIFLQRHGPLSVYSACLSFFVLAACSAATATLLRHKVKDRLIKKDS